MRLATPWFMILLVLIWPMIYYGLKSGGRFRFSSIDNLKAAGANSSIHPRQILLVFRIIAFILLIIGLSRPQSGKTITEITSDGVDIVLALDTSGSMRALDFELKGKRVERLDIVKNVVRNFIKKRASDRMGLVVFADEAFTQCPLTLDHGILVEFLKKIEIGMVGESTAIGSAIGISINRIKEIKSKSKIIILLTDGRNNRGSLKPLKAAELAKTYGIKIYTIGVGSHGKAPFLVDGFFGKTYTYQDVDIDEKTLRNIASITGGKYFRATQTGELSKIYEEIDKLETTKKEIKEYPEYSEIFHWFLVFALMFLLIEIFLGNTVLRKIP